MRRKRNFEAEVIVLNKVYDRLKNTIKPYSKQMQLSSNIFNSFNEQRACSNDQKASFDGTSFVSKDAQSIINSVDFAHINSKLATNIKETINDYVGAYNV